MNTATGAIYEPKLVDDFKASMADEAFFMALQKVDAERAALVTEMAAADAQGKLVEVSDQVAHTMRVGQREVDRRKRRRKAEREGRRRNR